MHFLVAWDIRSQGSCWKEINTAMREGIRAYSWIHPLGTVYILNIHTLNARESVKEKLNSVADMFPGEVNFLISPLYTAESDYYIHTVCEEDLSHSPLRSR
jgi:Cu/Ag efflux pump CusA